MNPNVALTEQVKFVPAFASAVPSTASPVWVSLKNAERCTVVILVKNATTVTGSAIALSQATAVAGTNAKALAFTTAYRDIDTGAGDTMSAFTVSSNTFTTDSTNSKNLLYTIEVKGDDLDVNNGFDCLRVTLGDATAATVTAMYILWPQRFGVLNISALTD
jgi:hypothetical protein